MSNSGKKGKSTAPKQEQAKQSSNNGDKADAKANGADAKKPAGGEAPKAADAPAATAPNQQAQGAGNEHRKKEKAALPLGPDGKPISKKCATFARACLAIHCAVL